MHSEDTKQWILVFIFSRTIYITILHVIFMQKLYEGPEELVEKMKSLSMTDEYCLAGENLDCLDKLYALCCPPLQAV